MRSIGFLLSVMLMVIAGTADMASAAKQKTPRTAAPEKPIYEAPMRVVIVRNSSALCEPICPQWIAAEGEITDATPAAFRKVFKQMGKNKLPVVIRSPGGSINAALAIGKMLRERQMTVAVGYTVFRSCSPASKSCKLPAINQGVYEGYIEEDRSFCNSACPMLLSGGTTRIASYYASIGLHEPKTVWTHEQVRYRDHYRILNGKKKVTKRQILSRKTVYDRTTFGLDKRLHKRLTGYYKTMGVDVAILNETVKAKYQDIYYLPEDQKTTLKLRTTSERAVFLDNPNFCGSGAKGAVCVEDKLRDPARLAMLKLADVGVKPNAAKMTFRLARLWGVHCITVCPMWIVAEGVIRPETPADFATFLKMQGLQKIAVVFHSTGGDPMAAMELGRMIRKAGFETALGQSEFSIYEDQSKIVPYKPQPAQIKSDGLCNGACALAYAGGTERHVNAETTMQLYHPTAISSSEGTAVAIAMNQHLIAMGVAPKFMSSLHLLKGKTAASWKMAELLTVAMATDAQNVRDLLSAEKCLANIWATSCLAPIN